MSTNPYLAPATPSPAKIGARAWILSLACMALGIYCGLFCLSAGIVAYLTGDHLAWVASAVGELGVLTWFATGWSIRHGRRVAGAVAGIIGVGALVALSV